MAVPATSVSAVMTRSVASVTPETPVAKVLELMLDQHISGLPVVERDGTPVGIVSKTDLLRLADHDEEEVDGHRLEAGKLLPGMTAATVMTPSVVAVGETC